MKSKKSQDPVVIILNELRSKLPKRGAWPAISKASNGRLQAQLIRKVFVENTGKKETIDAVIIATKKYLEQEENRLKTLQELANG